MRIKNRVPIRRALAATLALLMMLSMTVTAFAAEPDGPDDGFYPGDDPGVVFDGDDGSNGGYAEGIETGLADVPVQTEADIEAQAETTSAETVPVTDDELLPAVTGFSDVPRTHGFYTAIMDCAAKGITSGYADGTFRPTNSVTKAQFSVMLSRAFYPDKVEKLSTDENKAVAWFYPNVLALKNASVLKNTSFENYLTRTIIMNQSIPRYDMAQLMTNIMAAKGFSATAAQKTEAQKKISDYKSIPSQYQDAVKNVYALGIITGYSNGTFGGNNVMNRGQGCVVIYRMMKYTPAATKPSTGEGTYDDGKTNPGTGNTGTSTGNTGNTGSTGSSSTGNTGSSTSSTGTTGTTGVLANGKAITETNVLAIIQEMRKTYPHGMTWGANTTRPGTASTTMNMIARQYTRAATGGSTTSMQCGCGGFASLISDTIFGSGNTNPARKVPIEYVRPGDTIIKLDKSGKLLHVATAASRITEIISIGNEQIPVVNVYHGNVSGQIRDVGYYPIPKTYSQSKGYYVEIWTRYPTDNTTPRTGGTNSSGTSSGSSGTTDSNNTSSGSSGSSLANLTCDICGKTATTWFMNSTRTVHVCPDCSRTPAGKKLLG